MVEAPTAAMTGGGASFAEAMPWPKENGAASLFEELVDLAGRPKENGAASIFEEEASVLEAVMAWSSDRAPTAALFAGGRSSMVTSPSSTNRSTSIHVNAQMLLESRLASRGYWNLFLSSFACRSERASFFDGYDLAVHRVSALTRHSKQLYIPSTAGPEKKAWPLLDDGALIVALSGNEEGHNVNNRRRPLELEPEM